jgi:P27 family predicted phage terminase small subunit
MTLGRKPKPTVLKKLHHSHAAFNEREPKPVGDVSNAPDHFDDEQRAAWAYAVEHSPTGMLKMIDASILECWVVAHCLHRTAVKRFAAEGGEVLTLTPNGLLMQNPLLPIINRQAQMMMRAAAELGFAPTSRPKIGLSGGGELHGKYAPTKDEESLDEYLERAPDVSAVH